MKISNVKIHVTKDYEKFSFIEENRPIVPSKLVRLEQSYKQKYFGELYPIKVNPKYHILEGQHRYLVVKKLGLPMYYIISNKLKMEHIGIINSTQDRWTAYDCVRYYALQKRKHYMILDDFMDEWAFSLTTALSLLASNHYHGYGVLDSVRAGVFKIDKDVKQANKHAKQIHDFKPYFKGFKNRSFVLALLDMFEHPDYNHERMLTKTEYQTLKLVRCTDKEQYIRVLEGIYNYNIAKNKKVRF